MSTQTDARPTVRYTLACPAWCTVDHHLPTDSMLHERTFAAPALADAEPTVVLSQSDPVSGGEPEPASIAVYPPRDMLTAAEALDMGKALSSAGDSLQRSTAVAGRRVEVVQTLPDVAALLALHGLNVYTPDAVVGIVRGGGSASDGRLVVDPDSRTLGVLALVVRSGDPEGVRELAEQVISEPSSAEWQRESPGSAWFVELAGVRA